MRIGWILEKGDTGSIDSTDNNDDNKNAYVKIDFSFYNITSADTDADANNTNCTDDITEEVSNNINIDVDADAGARDIYGTNNMTEEFSNNTNIGASQSDGMSWTDKGKMSGANIKAGVGVDGTNKGGVDETIKGKVNGFNIKVSKKANTKASASIDSSSDGDSDSWPTDQHADLRSVAIAALAIIDNAEDFDLATADRPSLGAATSIFDGVFAVFAAFANTTLEKKTNVCESILSRFICH